MWVYPVNHQAFPTVLGVLPFVLDELLGDSLLSCSLPHAAPVAAVKLELTCARVKKTPCIGDGPVIPPLIGILIMGI